MKREGYTGIDDFRLIAAYLVVAIHTSPLASFSETGDFILTRVIARVAVPFFFMTSGYFLISRYACDTETLVGLEKKTALLYGVSILLYIPINIYNGYFTMDNLLPNIIKDLVFDGTMYHLWYLPASMLGAAIAWYLVRRLDYPKALVVTAMLYLIGLFGDSYYGIAEKISCLEGVYELLFQVSDYTRNGIFFAPVFFVLGGWMAEQNCGIDCLNWMKYIRRGVFSSVLLLVEAIILRHFELQRHDSMYLFLVPVMYFLFRILLSFEGERHTTFRTLSVVIYIIHPMVIVMIRLVAKLLHLQSVLIENSIVHFLAVCMVSTVLALLVIRLQYRYWPSKGKHNSDTDRAYLEINLVNLEHNVKVIDQALPQGCELMAVVKSEAYGHGMYEIAAHLDRLGVRAFAVAVIDEGIRLRQYGIRGEILILGYTAPERAKELKKYDLTQTLIDYEYARKLNRQRYDVKVHIKVDTGMHRLGFDWENVGRISCVFRMSHLKVCGIFTHLCVSDSLKEQDERFTNLQTWRFYQVLGQLEEEGIRVPKIHIQSSYGLLNYPELGLPRIREENDRDIRYAGGNQNNRKESCVYQNCSYMRAGIILYGVLSSPKDQTRLRLDLRPVLSLKARVVLVRKVKQGESIGYGRAFTAQRDSIIAILPIGYADGYPRSLSCGKGYVLIRGRKAPVAGKICMDQMAVDVTEVPGVKVGDTATLIGKNGVEEITASAVADDAESITNELLSRMGRRLKVVETS